MNYPKWMQSDNRIVVEISENAISTPSAVAIFKAVFHNETGQFGCEHSPYQDIPTLDFSRFPAEPAIRVYGEIPSNIKFEIGIITKKEFHPNNWYQDQCIINNCWHPISTDQTLAAKTWLSNSKLSDSENLTIGQLIKLRSAFDLPFIYLDQTVSFENSEKLEHTPTKLVKPDGLQATLYPYQETGINFLTTIAAQEVGCILGDEMGLGKTVQIIGLLLHLKQLNKMPCLVIAPATLLENWRREIATFAPTLQAIIHAGSQRTGSSINLKEYTITITSYETLIRDELLFAQIHWELVVLDEAQNIKNPAAARTLAAKRLNRTVSIAVTGTPVENRLEDLWSLADFSLKGMLGSLSEFKANFSDNVEDAKSLASLVHPILLRRKVVDVATDLPPRIDIPQPIEFTQILAESYEQIRIEALANYGPAGGLVATTRLRIFCAHPSLVCKQTLPPAEEVPKFFRLLEILEEIFANGEKALVFTTYQEMTDLFMAEIPKRWNDHFFNYIDGRVQVTMRQPTVDSFFNHHGPGALFLNPKAAGSGLNITAANHVIHYNPEWNPALTDQATARSYRRRQTRPVTVHSLFYVDSVEQVILDRASFKRGLANGAVSGHGGELDASLAEMALALSPLSKKGVLRQ